MSEASAWVEDIRFLFPHLQQGSRPSQAHWQRDTALARTESNTDERDKAVGEGTMRMTSRLRAAVNTRDGSIDAHGQHTTANSDRNSESDGADVAFLVSSL